MLLGVSFTDINKGYTVGTNGVIRVTSNGGNSWSAQASGTSRFLRDVSFSDATHGVIVGELGLILRTTDGINWSQQTSGTSQHLVHVHLLKNSVGLAVGQGGDTLKPSMAISWTPQSSGTNVELPGVYLINADTAIAVGFGGTILRTTNGGSTWGSVSVPGFNLDLRSVHFSGTTGVAVSIGGGILRSTNAGQSWTTVSSGTSSSLFAVRFRDGNTVYAAGTATFRVSTDGGISWAASTTTPFFGDIYSIAFSSTKGWAVGTKWFDPHAQTGRASSNNPFNAAIYNTNEMLAVQCSGGTKWRHIGASSVTSDERHPDQQRNVLNSNWRLSLRLRSNCRKVEFCSR